MGGIRDQLLQEYNDQYLQNQDNNNQYLQDDNFLLEDEWNFGGNFVDDLNLFPLVPKTPAAEKPAPVETEETRHLDYYLALEQLFLNNKANFNLRLNEPAPLINRNRIIKLANQYHQTDIANFLLGARAFEHTQKIAEPITLAKELGHGGFGVVYSGKLNSQDVAIKIPNTQERYGDLIFEISMLEYINQLRNETSDPRAANIVNFFGSQSIDVNMVATPALVFELAQGPLDRIAFDTSNRLLWYRHGDQASGSVFMMQIAEAILWLHDQATPIVHVDLKLNNCLVVNGRAKLADLGLAKLLRDDQNFDAMGTAHYAAPEALKHHSRKQKYTKKAEVWSFACMINETIMGEELYSRCNVPRKSKKDHRGRYRKDYYRYLVTDNQRDDQFRHLVRFPNQMAMLIDAGWQSDPNLRPTMKEIYNKLVEDSSHPEFISGKRLREAAPLPTLMGAPKPPEMNDAKNSDVREPKRKKVRFVLAAPPPILPPAPVNPATLKQTYEQIINKPPVMIDPMQQPQPGIVPVPQQQIVGGPLFFAAKPIHTPVTHQLALAQQIEAQANKKQDEIKQLQTLANHKIAEAEKLLAESKQLNGDANQKIAEEQLLRTQAHHLRAQSQAHLYEQQRQAMAQQVSIQQLQAQSQLIAQQRAYASQQVFPHGHAHGHAQPQPYYHQQPAGMMFQTGQPQPPTFFAPPNVRAQALPKNVLEHLHQVNKLN